MGLAYKKYLMPFIRTHSFILTASYSHQSQDVQLQQDAEEQRRMLEELQGIQNILSTSKQELLSQRRNNTRLQNSISDAEQENSRVPDAEGAEQGILNAL